VHRPPLNRNHRLMDLAADLHVYVSGRRDSKQEQILLQRILGLGRSERMEVLAPILDLEGRIGFDLANRAQLSRAHYLWILRRGLAQAALGDISSCLEATVHHLGWRKVFSVFREELTRTPRRAAFALHQLSALLREKESSEISIEYFRLIVLYHENGHEVTPKGAFEKIKMALRDVDQGRHFNATRLE
jgi:hypothetical protein